MTPPPAAFRLPPAACLFAVALLIAAGGCGEQSTGAGEGTAIREPAATTGTPVAETAPAAGCPRQLRAFVASLEKLRRELAVGLSYEQYVTEVKDLRASYEGIPIQRLSFDCLARGTPGERALNEHIDAANSWGECLADAACTTQAIEPVLQRRWRIAARHLSEAR